jgi:uncharacterized protein (DUF362 family)
MKNSSFNSNGRGGFAAQHARSSGCSRRAFLGWGTALAAGAPFALSYAREVLAAEANTASAIIPAARLAEAKVAIVACKSYGPEVKAALKQSFDLLGGIGSLVKNKTVTVKLNLTGTNFSPVFDLPVGESYMTHPSTALALTALLFEAGAKRVRLVESTQSRAELESTIGLADWDVNALAAMGKVEFENTRNLGKSDRYSHLRVPTGGYMFSSFEFNHSYEQTDVMVSLAKLKQHITAGVTLSMKNLFGLTPNALYGDEAGNEDATAGRGPLHGGDNPAQRDRFQKLNLPGLKKSDIPKQAGARVPRIVADICAARPIHLAIIDGITSMSGGEGPWCRDAAPLKLTKPGVIIAGLNPVSTDAVGTAVMGYANPRAARGTHPFDHCDNHLLLAEQAGVGTADLGKIDVRGLPIAKAIYPYG